MSLITLVGKAYSKSNVLLLFITAWKGFSLMREIWRSAWLVSVWLCRGLLVPRGQPQAAIAACPAVASVPRESQGLHWALCIMKLFMHGVKGVSCCLRKCWEPKIRNVGVAEGALNLLLLYFGMRIQTILTIYSTLWTSSVFLTNGKHFKVCCPCGAPQAGSKNGISLILCCKSITLWYRFRFSAQAPHSLTSNITH